MQDIMLSIYVATYNHEKYIGRALDSILMQKTKYAYEVLIGEDCSQDRTRDILKEYEKKYPNRFKIFYRDHNMHKEIPNNAGDLKYRCKGKYTIALEGDDFWTDENKIEKQISFLENHPEFIAVAHRCVVVDENSELKEEEYPECTSEIYTLEHLVSNRMPGQLTTVMYRNLYRDNIMDTSLMNKGLTPGDKLLYFSLACNGKIFCMQETMSAYRHVTTEGTSYSATYKYDFKKSDNYYKEMMQYSRKINHGEAEMCAEVLYFKNLISGVLYKQASIKDFMTNMQNINKKSRTVYRYICYMVNRYLLKKEVWV